MFAIVDIAVSTLVLVAARQPLVAALVAAAALGLLVSYPAAAADRFGLVVLLALVAVLFAVPEAALLAARGQTAPVQDGLLLIDAAARRLLGGGDPYGHDYLDDPALRAFFLPEFPVNPLLGHLVYPPGLLMLALPLSAVGLGAAWLWLPAVFALAGGAWLAAGRGGVIAVALNPLLLLDYLSLFNDLFFLAAGLAALGLLWRGRGLRGGLLLGIALGLKQSALVLLLPAVLIAVHALGPGARVRLAAAAGAVLMLLAAPFLAWDARAFLSDTAAYFYGSGIDSFPIRGFGLPGLLLQSGVLGSRWAPYPATVLQLIVLGPLLVLGGRAVLRNFTRTRLYLLAGAAGLGLFLLGRTLAPNYVTIAAVLLALALVSWLEDGDRAARLEGVQVAGAEYKAAHLTSRQPVDPGQLQTGDGGHGAGGSG